MAALGGEAKRTDAVPRGRVDLDATVQKARDARAIAVAGRIEEGGCSSWRLGQSCGCQEDDDGAIPHLRRPRAAVIMWDREARVAAAVQGKSDAVHGAIVSL